LDTSKVVKEKIKKANQVLIRLHGTDEQFARISKKYALQLTNVYAMRADLWDTTPHLLWLEIIPKP